MQNISEQERIRRDAMNNLREMGIEPFPAAAFDTTHYTNALKDGFKPEIQVRLAGRIMNRRIMGSASFAELLDSSGRIQVYFNRDILCPDEDKTLYNTVFKKLLDFGDFIGVEGVTFLTKTGEPSVEVHKFTVLSKSIKPLPVVKTDEAGVVHDAFTDPELRYRMRYVDLVVNEDVKKTFLTRSKIIQTMRDFFNAQNYLEVDTPVLQAIPGGAAARPFITHHNALNIPLYLRVANELYLKRLIVGGFDGVYEFSRNFRNEGMDRTHNPEFTIMEIYVAYKDYFWMMDFTEEMIERICLSVHGKTTVKIGAKEIDFKRPFARFTMAQAIEKYTGVNIENKSEEELRSICKDQGIEVNEAMGKGKLIDELFSEKCEHHFIQPTFITDYPIEMSPLCKRHRDNPELTERFELMVNGTELANAYSELNDPIDQRGRFEEQFSLAQRGDDEAMFIDYDFLRALEYGMPPTSGMGIGIDRLVMMLTGQESIQDVLLFPQMRPEKFETASNADAFVEAGVPTEWAEHLPGAGFPTVEDLKSNKATVIHQKLNGYRKKNKLEISAVQLEDVERWLSA